MLNVGAVFCYAKGEGKLMESVAFGICDWKIICCNQVSIVI